MRTMTKDFKQAQAVMTALRKAGATLVRHRKEFNIDYRAPKLIVTPEVRARLESLKLPIYVELMGEEVVAWFDRYARAKKEGAYRG